MSEYKARRDLQGRRVHQDRLDPRDLRESRDLLVLTALRVRRVLKDRRVLKAIPVQLEQQDRPARQDQLAHKAHKVFLVQRVRM